MMLLSCLYPASTLLESCMNKYEAAVLYIHKIISLNQEAIGEEWNRDANAKKNGEIA